MLCFPLLLLWQYAVALAVDTARCLHRLHGNNLNNRPLVLVTTTSGSSHSHHHPLQLASSFWSPIVWHLQRREQPDQVVGRTVSAPISGTTDPSNPRDAVASRWLVMSTTPNKPTVTMAVMQDLEYGEQFILWSCDANIEAEARLAR
jgi:hypothetical protein